MSHGVKVLVVTRDHRLRSLVETSFEAEGHYALFASSFLEANRALADQQGWDLLLFDSSRERWLSDQEASALIRQTEEERFRVLLEAGDDAWEAYARSWKNGGILRKPLLRQDLFRLIAVCGHSPYPARSESIKPINANPSVKVEELDDLSFFLAGSPRMLELHKNIRKLAAVDHPVLILGESGVGKEIVARLLHKYHAQPDTKFINVNTAAIPNELLESELFGYEAGAFTGAIKAKPGKFELAHRGTLLLDEIGEMSPSMQAKLLHVLQDGSFTRLGGRAPIQVEVRVLAATNVQMESAIAAKRFREDLYYRISTFTLVVPPLRERREEIPHLMEQMALRCAIGDEQEPPPFSARLLEAAQEYHWPGNLRELRNFVIRLLVLKDEAAVYEQLRGVSRVRAAAPNGYSGATIATLEPPANGLQGMKDVVSNRKHEIESVMIREALLASGWNRRRAASNLNISYRALLYKIQQHGLSV